MPQTMRCILCYNNSIFITNAKTQVNNGLILYNITNGITTVKNMCLQIILTLQKCLKK
jgi:hypothetical protein